MLWSIFEDFTYFQSRHKNCIPYKFIDFLKSHFFFGIKKFISSSLLGVSTSLVPTPPPELTFHDKKRIEKPPPSFWKLRFRYLHFCVWKTPSYLDKINAQTHNQNQRRRDVVNIFDVPLVIKIVLNFSNYSECYQPSIGVTASCCGRLTTKLRACFRHSFNRHDVSLNITRGSFVWQKKKVRSIFS